MEKKEQLYVGKVTGVNEDAKYVEAIILHFDEPNENFWRPLSGCLDAFLARIEKAGKHIPAYYQHDEKQLIGLWKELKIEGGVLSGRLYYDNIPFVNEVVLPQLRSGSLQGASPAISPIKDTWNKELNIWDIVTGALVEASLVGLPAGLNANILELRASLEAQDKNDFEFDLLTL